jgi:hypothetical protein
VARKLHFRKLRGNFAIPATASCQADLALAAGLTGLVCEHYGCICKCIVHVNGHGQASWAIEHRLGPPISHAHTTLHMLGAVVMVQLGTSSSSGIKRNVKGHECGLCLPHGLKSCSFCASYESQTRQHRAAVAWLISRLTNLFMVSV